MKTHTRKLMMATLCLFALLMTALPAYADSSNSCRDGLWREYNSVLWDGPNRWFGQWTRNGCSSTYTVVWRGPNNRLDTYDITMVKNGNYVAFVSPYCRYTGRWSSNSEIISGKHGCGSRGGSFTLHPGRGFITQ